MKEEEAQSPVYRPPSWWFQRNRQVAPRSGIGVKVGDGWIKLLVRNEDSDSKIVLFKSDPPAIRQALLALKDAIEAARSTQTGD